MCVCVQYQKVFRNKLIACVGFNTFVLLLRGKSKPNCVISAKVLYFSPSAARQNLSLPWKRKQKCVQGSLCWWRSFIRQHKCCNMLLFVCEKFICGVSAW